MAKDKDKDDKTPPVLEEKTIEEWAAGTGTPAWAFEGLKVRQNWAAGKVVTEQEYQKALQEFLGGPMVKEGDNRLCRLYRT